MNRKTANFTLITEQKHTDAKAREKLNPHLHGNVPAAAAHVQKQSLPTATTAEVGGTEASEQEAVRIALTSAKGGQDDGTFSPEGVEGIVIWVVCVCVCGGGAFCI